MKGNSPDDVSVLYEVIHLTMLILKTIRMDYKNDYKAVLIRLIKKL